MSKRHILVLDSGLGGLTIHDEISKLLPGASIAYFADHLHFPYGAKDESWLGERAVEVVRHFSDLCQPDVVVVACNTASTVVLPRLRANFTCPIVGVVPAIKTAAEQSPSGKIGLLATEGTVKRSYTKKLTEDFASHCKLLSIGSNELVQLAEDKIMGRPVEDEVLRRICAPFFENSRPLVDTVVLGCTHFPILRDDLARALPAQIQWLDSGEAIAKRVQSVIGEITRENSLAVHSFFSSGSQCISKNLRAFLDQKNFNEVFEGVLS